MDRVVWIIEKAMDRGDWWAPEQACFSSAIAVQVWKRLSAANPDTHFRVVPYTPEQFDG